MSINKTYAVFGLGRYGLSVAKELVNNGAEVIAVDSNENTVKEMIEMANYLGMDVKAYFGDFKSTSEVKSFY